MAYGRRTIPIIGLDLNTLTIKEFSSLSQVRKEYPNAQAVLDGLQHQTRGMFFIKKHLAPSLDPKKLYEYYLQLRSR